MGVIEKATQWMENTANNNAHGYDQQYRWGERGDYDCSSAVITAWTQAGVNVKGAGATYTGNMYNAFIKCGFKDVTNLVNLQTGAGLKRGDVLLNHVKHTAMVVNSTTHATAEARMNENGKVNGGKAGDQTGQEFVTNKAYRNYPWNCVLRYQETNKTETKVETKTNTIDKCQVTVKLPELSYGMTGSAVKLWQTILCIAGYVVDTDGSFGNDTKSKTELFETSRGIVDMPDVVGQNAWKAGLNLLSANKTF